jgi:RNA-binding protein YhbY
MVNMIKLNLGKKGLTPEFIENLKKLFVNVEHVRIAMLKSSTRDKSEAKKWAEEIVNSLGKNFGYKIIGYTLVIRKWRKTKDVRN